MTRRLLLASLLVAGIALSSCSTFERGVAASVGDAELSEDALAELVEAGAPVQEPFDDAPGEVVRLAIRRWVALHSFDQAGRIEQERKDAARAEVETDPAFPELPEVEQELQVLNRAIQLAADAGELTEEELVDVVAEADVYVNSHYGHWTVLPEDPSIRAVGIARLIVLPLGQPIPTVPAADVPA